MKNLLKTLLLFSLAVSAGCKNDKTKEEPYTPEFSVPEAVNKLNAPGNGYTIPVEASSDVEWTATVSPTGAGMTLVTSSGKGSGAVVYDLSENTDGDPRFFTVTFSASSDIVPSATFDPQCVVKQIGVIPDVEILPMGKQTITVAANADYKIDVVSNVEWNVSVELSTGSPVGWCTVTSPTTAQPATGTGEVHLNILANTSESKRTATVTVFSTADPNVKKVLEIEQAGIVPSIVISPTGTASIPSDAVASYQVTVTSNVEWTATLETDAADGEWISITSPTVATTGNATVTLNILENDTDAARVATLKITSTAHPTDNTLNKTLEITQLEPNVTYTISIPGYTTLTAGEATMNYTAYPTPAGSSAVDVTVAVDAEGSTLTFTSMIAEGKYTLTTLSYDGGGSSTLNAVFETNSAGEVTSMEHWDTNFSVFGGTYAERPIEIASPANLATLATAVNAGDPYAGLYLKQTQNISLSTYTNWTPIGTSAAKFSGRYDGNSKQIIDLKITAPAAGYALFGFTAGTADVHASISNLTVKGAGGASGTVDVDGMAAGKVAGLLADAGAYTDITNCVNNANVKGTVSSGACLVAGLISTMAGNVTVTGCANYGEVTAGGGNQSGGVIGGIAGASTVTSCTNYGTVTLIGNSGGVIGNIGNFAVTVSKCANKGAVTLSAQGGRFGAIVGSFDGSGTVSECYNAGVLTGFGNTGSIAGWMGSSAKVENCYNKAVISNGQNVATCGAIVGNMTTANTSVKNCYNIGAASGTQAAKIGGVVGTRNTTAAITDCYFIDTYTNGVSAGTAAGTSTSNAEFISGTPFTDWPTAIWRFTPGSYPTLRNNPE